MLSKALGRLLLEAGGRGFKFRVSVVGHRARLVLENSISQFIYSIQIFMLVRLVFLCLGLFQAPQLILQFGDFNWHLLGLVVEIRRMLILQRILYEFVNVFVLLLAAVLCGAAGT